MNEHNENSQDFARADVGDIVKLSMIGLRLILELIKLWGKDKNAVSKNDIERLRKLVDKDEKIFE